MSFSESDGMIGSGITTSLDLCTTLHLSRAGSRCLIHYGNSQFRSCTLIAVSLLLSIALPSDADPCSCCQDLLDICGVK